MDDQNNKIKKEITFRPGGGFIFYAILLLILVGFSIFVFGNNYGATETTSLSDLMNYITSEDYEVSTVVVNGTKVVMTYKEKGTTTNKTLVQQVPAEYVDELVSELQKAQRNGQIESYDYTEPFDWSAVINIALFAATLIVVFMVFMSLSRQAKDSNSVFSFGNNRARLSDPNEMEVRFTDVAGAVEEKEELEEVVDFLKYPQKYLDIGAKIPKGILLYGPPGTGKTLLARAVAGEAGVKFFYISGSDFVEMLVGVGASRVRSLFADAKREAPSVVFIDEIDAVGRKRGAGLGGGQDEREQTLNQILVEMDGFSQNTNVIVIAATNRVDVLDPALLRPGRFDRRIMVNMPDTEGREEILKIHARNKKLADDIDLHEIALSTVGFTGADLENLLNEAALLAARRNLEKITQQEITDATFRVQMGPEKKSKKLTDKVKRLTAYHEAGHAVVLRATSDFQKVDRVTIIPAGGAGGYTAFKPIEDTDFYTEKMLLDMIKMSLGGRAAEEIFLGEVSTGAASDLKQCNHIAMNMIKRYGLSSKFRNLVFGDDNDEVFLGYSFGQVQSYSDSTAAAIDQEVKEIIDSCYASTKAILEEKRDVVEALAKRLMEKNTVDGPEFEKIFASGGVIEDEGEGESAHEESGESGSGESAPGEPSTPEESGSAQSEGAPSDSAPGAGDGEGIGGVDLNASSTGGINVGSED